VATFQDGHLSSLQKSNLFSLGHQFVVVVVVTVVVAAAAAEIAVAMPDLAVR